MKRSKSDIENQNSKWIMKTLKMWRQRALESETLLITIIKLSNNGKTKNSTGSTKD